MNNINKALQLVGAITSAEANIRKAQQTIEHQKNIVKLAKKEYKELLKDMKKEPRRR